MTVIALSRFRADVSRALARQGRKLLEAVDMPAQMQALTPLEAYYIVKELGVDEALPLLRHATEDQRRALIDLDCWDGHDFSPEELDAWLAAFAAEGKASLAAAFCALDDELQVLTLAESFMIFDIRSDDVPETDNDIPRMTTPDGFFVLLIRPEACEREVEPFTLIDALYSRDLSEAMRLLISAKWELPAQLLEDAHQFRAGRLQDLGFPTPEEAARLFAPPPNRAPAPPAAGGEPCPLPALYAGALHDESLFVQAMGQVQSAEALQRLESELVFLVNAAIVGYGQTPRSLAHSGRVARWVRDGLTLGLQHGGHLTLDSAAQALITQPLLHIFQRGQQALTSLARAARQLAADPVVRSWLDRTVDPAIDLDTQDRAFLRAVASPRPLHAGHPTGAADDAQAFSDLGEIAVAQERLANLAERLQ